MSLAGDVGPLSAAITMSDGTTASGPTHRAPGGTSPIHSSRISKPCALASRGLTYVRNRRPVLRGIDLAIAEGEIVGVTGANGEGKTTLLQCLAGALTPSAGHVEWFGESARSLVTHRLIGLLGHESGLYLTLTARENLLFAGRMCGLDQVADRADELLSATGLKHHAQQHAARLSRGLRQRLAIARAIIHDPPILLLDEPFTSLDASGCDWLAQFLSDLRDRRRSILVVTHVDQISRGLPDRLLCLRAGRVESVEHYCGRRLAPADFDTRRA